jgi:hypothetical protein
MGGGGELPVVPGLPVVGGGVVAVGPRTPNCRHGCWTSTARVTAPAARETVSVSKTEASRVAKPFPASFSSVLRVLACRLLVFRLFTACFRHQPSGPFCFSPDPADSPTAVWPARAGLDSSDRLALPPGRFLLPRLALRWLSRLSRLSLGSRPFPRRVAARHRRARPWPAIAGQTSNTDKQHRFAAGPGGLLLATDPLQHAGAGGRARKPG